MIDCLKCINSACCKLTVELDLKEYKRLVNLGLKDKMITYTDLFLKQNPKYKKHKIELDKMHYSNFAKINKNKNGYFVFLDKDMKCTIYENRPIVCKNYKTNSCKNIRELCQ